MSESNLWMLQIAQADSQRFLQTFVPQSRDYGSAGDSARNDIAEGTPRQTLKANATSIRERSRAIRPTLTSILSLARERRTQSAGEGCNYFGEACNAAWYSGLLWYSTRRNPQLISVERSLVFAFFSFRKFSIFAFSSGC